MACLIVRTGEPLGRSFLFRATQGMRFRERQSRHGLNVQVSGAAIESLSVCVREASIRRLG